MVKLSVKDEDEVYSAAELLPEDPFPLLPNVCSLETHKNESRNAWEKFRKEKGKDTLAEVPEQGKGMHMRSKVRDQRKKKRWERVELWNRD
jgi:hypothetical protein